MVALRVARVIVPALAVALLLAVQIRYFDRGFVPGDAFVYLAAGERLNDGHLLYALSPGDRPVNLQPPYWTVPLLSPPPIAVLFRPLAALPAETGVYLWWLACIAMILGVIGALLVRIRLLAGTALLVLAIPTSYEIGVGNLNALVLMGFAAVWLLIRTGRTWAAGGTLALIVALKLTPVVLVWWLLVVRQWSALRAFIVAGAAIAVISVLGAGLSAHLEYLGIVRQTSTVGTSDLSLAGMARSFGVAPDVASMLPIVAAALGLLLMWLLRRRPSIAYSVAVVTMLAGSPVVNINWFTLAFAALVPAAWPMEGREQPTSHADELQTRHRLGAIPAQPPDERGPIPGEVVG